MEYINMWKLKSQFLKLKDLEVDKDSVITIDIGDNYFVNGKIYRFSNSEHPVVYYDYIFEKNIVNIDEEYFYNNREKIIRIVEQICINSKQDKIDIANLNLITDEVIMAIANNDNIKEVTLGSKSSPYSLSRKHYELLKNSGKSKIITYAIDTDLEDVYDGIIYYNMEKPILADLKYKQIQSYDEIDLTNISEEQLKNLNLIDSTKEVHFNLKNIDSNLLLKAILTLRQNNCFSKIKIDFYDCKDKLYKALINSDINYNFLENVYVGKNFLEEISIINFIKYEKRLYDFIEPAKNLSPFEKYLFVYNLVKQFKEYKENYEDEQQSRNLYNILDNDFIVCVGFTTLLNDLLTKLGIESSLISVTVDIGLDNVKQDDFSPLGDNISTVDGYHSRIIVNLVDPKYDMDGYYIADPTWDNYKESDLYSHSLITASEEIGIKRYNRITNSAHELLFSNSIDNFYDKVNLSIQRKIETNTKYDFLHFIKKIINIISKYDEMFKKHIEKNFNLKKSDYGYSNEEINSIMDYVGNYVVSNDLEIDKLRKFVEEEKLNVEEIGSILKSNNLSKFFLRSNYYLIKHKDKNKVFIEIFSKLFELIQSIDKELSIKIEEKFGNISISNRVYSKEEVQNILTYIGENIVAKSNNIVSGEKYKEAITVLYRDVYKYPDFEERVNLTMKTNKNFQELVFPKFIKEDKDGIRTVVYNDVNKFDLESETSKSL